MNNHIVVRSKILYVIIFLTISFLNMVHASDNSIYDVKISLVNKFLFGNQPVDVQILDDKAYILAGMTVSRFNVADPGNTKEQINFANIAGVDAMAFSSRYGYFLSNGRIKIFDLTANPPLDRGYFETQNAISKLCVLNGYLFLLRSDLGLFVYDIKNPEMPILKGNQIIFGDPNSMFIKGQSVYITSSNAHFEIIDYTDPVKLPVVGTYFMGTNFYDVFVQDNFAYISQGSTGVQVLNIETPSTPRWETNIFSRKSSKQVVVSNYYAWVNDDNTIQAFYNKDARSYLYAGVYDNEGASINRIAVINGKYILLCSNDGYLKILQISYNY